MADSIVGAESLSTVECHFNWKPELDSTKVVDLSEVIKKTERKLINYPQFSIVYHTTLAYLYTLNPVVNFNKATEHLDKATSFNELHRNDDSAQSRVIVSEYIVKANRLFLQLKRQPKKSLSSLEIAELDELLSVDANRAAVFAIKGATFNCFGPKKCHEGVTAYEEALKYRPNKFDWLWGLACILARNTRQMQFKLPDAKQLKLWKRAEKELHNLTGLSESSVVQKTELAIFYANYAEALLPTAVQPKSNLREQCKQFMKRSIQYLYQVQKDANLDMNHCHVVFNIGFKVYRWLNEFRLRDELLSIAESVQDCMNDPSYFLEIAIEVSNTNKAKAVELLEKGQELAGQSRHIWIDLKWVELQQEEKGEDWTVGWYDTLQELHACYDKSVSHILVSKASFLIGLGKIDEAMNACIDALEQFPDIDKAGYKYWGKISETLKSLKYQYPHYFAWYLDNIFRPRYVKDDVEQLYQQAIGDDVIRNDFVHKHLGQHFMRLGNFDSAIQQFRRLLSSDHEAKAKLLARAALQLADANDDLDADGEVLQTLKTDCLALKCKDACERILKILHRQKQRSKVTQYLMHKYGEQQQVQDLSQSLFFETQQYELCAEMQLVVETGFAIDEKCNDGSYKTEVKKGIKELLGLPQLFGHQLGQGDCENLLRHHRFSATENFLKLRDRPGDAELRAQLYNNIIGTMTQAKIVLDRCFNSKFAGTVNKNVDYPHAFEMLKLELTRKPSFKRAVKNLPPDVDKKMWEMEKLIEYLISKRDTLLNKENVRSSLKEKFKNSGKFSNVDTDKKTRDIFDFMARRELRILRSENCWLILWIYTMNNEKHSTKEVLVDNLDNYIDKFKMPRGAQCEEKTTSAYDLAHWAAEFAEETFAVLMSEAADDAISHGMSQVQL